MNVLRRCYLVVISHAAWKLFYVRGKTQPKCHLHFVSALCLLDLTASFDTVDHDLLFLRLERQFGLHGVTLSGSGLTGAADLIVFGLPMPPQGPCTSTARFSRVQSSARDCLSCILCGPGRQGCHHHHHIRFWYLWCCGCPGLRGRQHLATPHTRSPWIPV